MTGSRPAPLLLLMGPPGSGKSTLGRGLDALGIAHYEELEPLLVDRYGQGEAFAQHRPEAHAWIRDHVRQRLEEAARPVAHETTGISDRPFLDEIRQRHPVVAIKLDTPRDVCIARVTARPKGEHVTDHSAADTGAFFDHWHGEIAPTYGFQLTVGGRDLEADATAIRDLLGREPPSAADARGRDA